MRRRVDGGLAGGFRVVKFPSFLSALPGGLGNIRSRSGSASHQSRFAFFAMEISISVVLNVVMAAVATRFLSNALAADGRFDHAFIDIALASSGAMMGFVIPVTLGIRRRVRRGHVAPLAGGPLGPANVVVRTALLCVFTPLLLGVPAAWLLATLAPHGTRFLLFKSVYGAIIALTVTPIVIVAALRDH